jgi:AcrR family transcriptional regulator
LRSVYVHFDDLDDLFAAAGARQAEEIAHLLYPVDAGLPLPERIGEVVRQRALLWEALAPVRRAALVWASSSPSLQERTQAVTQRSVRDLSRIFATEVRRGDPELAPVLLEALNAAASSGTWEVLRTERELSIEDATAVVTVTLTALLEDHR